MSSPFGPQNKKMYKCTNTVQGGTALVVAENRDQAHRYFREHNCPGFETWDDKDVVCIQVPWDNNKIDEVDCMGY